MTFPPFTYNMSWLVNGKIGLAIEKDANQKLF